MNQAIVALLMCGALGLLVTFTSMLSFRKLIGWLLLAINLLSTGALLWFAANQFWVISASFLSIYAGFNYYRLAYSPINQEYLIRACRRTAFRLWIAQVIIVFSSLFLTNHNIIDHQRWIILSFLELALALILFSSTLRYRRVTRRIHETSSIIDSNAPTLTVLIPARNETESLNQCLMSLVQSDYPKLEIIVLDDQSTIKRTSEIIRSFAQQGVEFIPGQPIERGWLAKNWAYQQLLEAANGEIILFCGADTRFDRDALRYLVSSLEVRNKSMLSILPKNRIPFGNWQLLLQPLRYSWEVSLPRRQLKRPPVLSTCWVAKRNYLNSAGGFKAVSRRVVCESYFARMASKHDGYSFFQYDGVVSDKEFPLQLETAIRLRYPQLHRQPELIAFVSLIEIIGVLGPIVIIARALANHSLVLLVISGVTIIITTLTFALVTNITYRRNIISVFLLWPIAAFVDLLVLNISMVRYEFGTIYWKGRSVAPYVIHADVV